MDSFKQCQGTGECEHQITCTQNIACGGFLQLLEYLRIVVLQDAVAIGDLGSAVRHLHPVFQTEEFASYASALRTLIETTPNSSQQTLQQVSPVLLSELQRLESQIQANSTVLRAVDSRLRQLSVTVSFDSNNTSPASLSNSLSHSNDPLSTSAPIFSQAQTSSSTAASMEPLFLISTSTAAATIQQAITQLSDLSSKSKLTVAERKRKSRYHRVKTLLERYGSSANPTKDFEASVVDVQCWLDMNKKTVDWFSKLKEIPPSLIHV